jgi:glycosyltransferase involved in cell wall biosynthesis
MATPVVLLTPNLTGQDGISAVARLVVGTFDRVSVVALHERTDLRTFAGATVRGAGGAAAGFALAALCAAARGPRAMVIVNHVHLAPAALAFSARGSTLVSILHGIEAWTRLTWLQRAALIRSDHLIAVSAFSRDRFRAENPQFAERHVDVCHHGIGPAAVPDTPSDQIPAALIVGRMTAGERYKGHDALIEIWPAVLAAVPDAVLRIVGDGDDRGRLEQKAAAMGLGDHVVFTGGIDDHALQREYQRATVFTMPSPREGFGLVFLEAMRAARSCIGCCGAASEIIDDGNTGWIVEPGDRDRLTERVIRTLRDRSESVAMGARGRDRYLQHFTEAHFRRRLTALMTQ